MQLDVAAANYSRRLDISDPQLYPAPVYAGPRLTVVLHSDPEGHVRGAPIDGEHARSTDVTRVRERGVKKVPRDTCAPQVTGRIGAVVEDIHVPPELAVLASTVGAKIDELSRVADYEPATGDEVARRRNEVGLGGAARERPRNQQRYREQHVDRSTHFVAPLVFV